MQVNEHAGQFQPGQRLPAPRAKRKGTKEARPPVVRPSTTRKPARYGAGF